jgi:hypothetical protein
MLTAVLKRQCLADMPWLVMAMASSGNGAAARKCLRPLLPLLEQVLGTMLGALQRVPRSIQVCGCILVQAADHDQHGWHGVVIHLLPGSISLTRVAGHAVLQVILSSPGNHIMILAVHPTSMQPYYKQLNTSTQQDPPSYLTCSQQARGQRCASS